MHTIRTIFAAHLATTKALGRPFTVLDNSTLNQKFNLHYSEIPRSNEYPIIGYVGIGNKGADYEVTTSNYVLTKPVPHLPRHSSLYNFIPFVLRRADQDIAAEERSKYRMRVPLIIGNLEYIAYYLRALTLNDVIPSVELRNVTDSNISTSTFTPTLSDLSPEHPDISHVDINNPSGDYLISTAKVNLVLTSADITNIMDACAIIFGDPRYAVINEIALCSGIDRVVQGTVGSTTTNYVDLVAAQVNAFIYQYHALSETTTEVSLRFDIGSSEPLLT